MEREDALAALSDGIAAALSGTGSLVLLEGPAGLGKTELVAVACEEAARNGLEVLRAHGGQVEREVALGAARQLFAPIAALPADERSAVLAGAAALAAGPLGLGTAAPTGSSTFVTDPTFADFHGLYWLAANMAARRPLLLAVDDAHWLDPVSLRWLVYMAQRLEGVPVLMVVATRPREPGAPEAELAALAIDRKTRVVRPGPLSEDAAAVLVEQALGAPAAPEFCTACRNVTAGNPFYLRQLVDQLVADGIAPSAAHVERVQQLGPEAIARSIVWRLATLPAAAASLARAVAVLERDADLQLAARLAELTEDEASIAADALTGVQILMPARPLSFVHPVVRSAFYGDMPPGERARRHATAAALLRESGAAPERVAAHLLVAEPAGDPASVDSLPAPPEAAAGRGATAAAAAYLERALREPPAPDQRAAAVLDHARALVRMYSEDGPAALAAALELIDDPLERAGVAKELGLAQTMLGRLADARATIERALVDLGDADRDLAFRLEVDRLSAGQFDHTVRQQSQERLERLANQLGDRLHEGELELGERLAIATLAFDRLSSRHPYTETAALAQRALGDGELLELVGPDAAAVHVALWALCYTDQWESGKRHIDSVLAEAQRRGSWVTFSLVTSVEATLLMRRGQVLDAEASARASYTERPDAAIEHPLIVATLVETMVERGDLDGAWSLLEQSGYTGDLTQYPLVFATLLNARGRLRVARNEVRAGIDDLLAVGIQARRFGRSNGTFMPWRTTAAIALDSVGEHDEARALAREALDVAEGFGAPRAVGIALRGIGMVERDLTQLERSARELDRAGAQLELAYSCTELGAALKRAGRRKEAREPLARAIDLAERCGATVLADRAVTELKATGAKPRRRMLTGVESLTASERRIAQMAVSGMTNRDIAQALFVTVKTVESHMIKLYRKLDVHSRTELAEKMADVDVT